MFAWLRASPRSLGHCFLVSEKSWYQTSAQRRVEGPMATPRPSFTLLLGHSELQLLSPRSACFPGEESAHPPNSGHCKMVLSAHAVVGHEPAAQLGQQMTNPQMSSLQDSGPT